MEIFEVKHLVKCDFNGCNNLAKYSFSTKRLLKKDLCFCEDCLRQMYEIIAKMQKPRSVSSPFRLNKRMKKYEER